MGVAGALATPCAGAPVPMEARPGLGTVGDRLVGDAVSGEAAAGDVMPRRASPASEMANAAKASMLAMLASSAALSRALGGATTAPPVLTRGVLRRAANEPRLAAALAVSGPKPKVV